MRVQVVRETTAGYCSNKACRFNSIRTQANRFTVFVGETASTSDWFCWECYPLLNDRSDMQATFEIETPKVDRREAPSRRMKNTSRKREVQIAEEIGGRRQPGSGSTPFAKGDVRKKGEFRIEHKDCYGVEFKVHRRELLDKIRAECSRGEHPVVVVTFREKSTHENLEAWAIMPYETWLEKTDAAGKHR